MISVIIPTYNTDLKMLCRSVKSVLKQTFGDFECIIVDDGSESEYAKKLDMLTKKDSRIRILHKPNGGAGSARNFGVENAAGEFIFFVDADDYISPYALENAFDIAGRTGADMVVGGLIHIEPYKKPPFERKEKRVILVSSHEDIAEYVKHITNFRIERFCLAAGNIGGSLCSRLIRKKIISAVPLETGRDWDEDILWNISAAAECGSIAVTDNLWYAYVINPDSKVRGYKGDRAYEFQSRAKQQYALLKKLWPECMQGAYYRIWVTLLRYCHTDTFHNSNPKSISQRYRDFCNAIDFPEFKEAMERIDFDNEIKPVNRLVKKTIGHLLRLKDKRAAYAVLGVCIKFIKW